MSTHYCINCWKCMRGCLLCKLCACTDEELEEAHQKKFDTPQKHMWGEIDAEVMGPVVSKPDEPEKPDVN